MYLCRQMKQFIRIKTFWVLAIVCCLTLLPFIGLSDFHTKGEPREAIVSLSMLDSGDWVLPRNCGGDMAFKPPFFHWCVAACGAVVGGISEGAARFPSAVALLAMTLAGYSFFARRRSSDMAAIAALAAFTSFELHRAGANCRVDMVLTAFTVGAIYCLYSWWERGKRGLPWLGILLMGLGTMTKGPVGSIIPCLVVGLFMLCRRERFWPTLGRMALVGTLSLALYAAWFIAAWQEGGQAFLDLMWEENIGRMTGTMSYDSCVNPWPYNILTLITGWVPWTVLGLVGLAGLVGCCGKFRRPTCKGFLRRLRSLDDTDLLSLVAIVAIFIFYCIPQSKRSVYLMPMYPFIGWYVARLMQWMWRRRPAMLVGYGHFVAALAVALTLTFAAVQLGLVPDSIMGSGRHAGQNIEMLHALAAVSGLGSWLLALVPLGAAVCWWAFGEHRAGGKQTAYAIIALVMSIYIAMDGVYTPTVLGVKSKKAFAAQIDSTVPASAGQMYEYMANVVEGDPLRFFDIDFYLGGRVRVFDRDQPSEGFLLVSEADMEQSAEMFAKQGYRFHTVVADGRGLTVQQFYKE